ncbi:MAG: tRNA 2-thiouridine(34) synthase MnmA [Planctomycetota bacterium]
MSRRGKVIVAMSGGVDSSVAAALLKEQGYECVGVFMRVGVAPGTSALGPGPTDASAPTFPRSPVPTLPRGDVPTSARPHLATPGARRLKHGCCSVEDALDARAIAGRLGIPFYVLNFQADFERIIDYFVDEYIRARTPNPCVVCNTQLKFGKLLRYADAMDAEFVATGHYARIVRGDVGTWGRGDVGTSPRGNVGMGEGGNISTAPPTSSTPCSPSPVPGSPFPVPCSLPSTSPPCFLACSRNLSKDQSYVLFGIRRDDLRRCLFPLGEIADKAEVRRLAADLGLKVHDKPESQEICFVPDRDYKRLVRERRPEALRLGEIRDAAGNLRGTHEGVAGFTIGQRRGLRLAAGHPIYVTKLDAAANTVTIGPRDELLSGGLVAEEVNWLVDGPPAGPWFPVTIKIRHQHTSVPGRIRTTENRCLEARFDVPQPAVTPGQAAVFYGPGGIVLGGGWIARALSV